MCLFTVQDSRVVVETITHITPSLIFVIVSRNVIKRGNGRQVIAEKRRGEGPAPARPVGCPVAARVKQQQQQFSLAQRLALKGVPMEGAFSVPPRHTTRYGLRHTHVCLFYSGLDGAGPCLRRRASHRLLLRGCGFRARSAHKPTTKGVPPGPGGID